MNDIFSSLKYVCTILIYSENIQKNFENFNALFSPVEDGKNKRISFLEMDKHHYQSSCTGKRHL